MSFLYQSSPRLEEKAGAASIKIFICVRIGAQHLDLCTDLCSLGKFMSEMTQFVKSSFFGVIFFHFYEFRDN